MNGLEVAQLNATITQLSLANKKLTRSIFSQIEYAECFDAEMNFIGDPVYGYIRDKDSRYLLWTTGGKFRRIGLTRYYELKNNIARVPLENVKWFLYKIKMEYDVEDNWSEILSESIINHQRYLAMVNKVKEFLKGLVDKQIYL